MAIEKIKILGAVLASGLDIGKKNLSIGCLKLQNCRTLNLMKSDGGPLYIHAQRFLFLLESCYHGVRKIAKVS